MTAPGLAATGRFAAVDVHYPPTGGARAAVVVASDCGFAAITQEHTATLDTVAEYQPGAFFTRELPALRAVLAGVAAIDLLIVDSYVYLDGAGRPGLGAHAHAEFAVPVIGVAKTAFRGADHAIEVTRGVASRPLFVTAAGLPADRAAELVRAMAGPFRMPDALRRVDQLSRGSGEPPRPRLTSTGHPPQHP